jgi:hypothetical protein
VPGRPRVSNLRPEMAAWAAMEKSGSGERFGALPKYYACATAAIRAARAREVILPRASRTPAPPRGSCPMLALLTEFS